jgi:hypothetical protein
MSTSSVTLWLAVALPLLFLYLITLRTNAYDMSPDTVAVTSSAWQLAHHGTPRLPAEGAMYHAWLIPSGDGHVVSNREPGLVFLAAVFYRILPFAGIFDVGPASIAAAVVTSAAMGVLAVVLRRLVSTAAAWVGAVIVGTAMSTWAVSGTSLWPHGPDQLYVALAMLTVANRRWMLAGGAFGFATVTRPPLAVVAVIVAAWCAWDRRSWRPILQIGVGSCIGLACFLWYSRLFWGGGLQSQYTATGGGDFIGAFSDWSPGGLAAFAGRIVGTLIAPGRGIAFGAPFVLALLPGARAGWRVAPPWIRASAVGGLAYLCVQLKANDFGGGATFWSFRYPLETLTLLAPLGALAWREYVATSHRRQALFAFLVIASATLQAVGATSFRRRANNWWLFTDLAATFDDHLVTATTTMLVGLAAAVLVYVLLWRRGARVSDAPGSQTCSE